MVVTWQERLKILPRLDNMDSLGLPGWITGYNGKPALLTKSGAIYRGDDYLEIDIDAGASYAYLAQWMLYKAYWVLPHLVFDMGFILEGRAADELPEQVLCCYRLNKVPWFDMQEDPNYHGDRLFFGI